MRTIKFRAWIKDLSKLVNVTEIHWPQKGYSGTVMFEIEDGFADGIEYDGAILQQFTGLKDKNGVDVYEGDIVQISYKMDEHGDLETYKSEVVFEDGAFGDDLDYFCNYLMLPNFSMEVIGNIFEHGNSK